MRSFLRCYLWVSLGIFIQSQLHVRSETVGSQLTIGTVRIKSLLSFHSGISRIGLIALSDRLRFGAELFLLLLFGLTADRLGAEKTTIGGCLVASHDIVGVATSLSTRLSPQRSSSSRSRRSSSEIRELGWLPLLSYTWLKADGCAERKFPAGHEG